VACKGQYKSKGIVVDAVSDVLHGAYIDITQSPDFGEEMVTHAISGLATFEKKMVVLLDVDRLLEDEEMASNSDADDDENGEDEDEA
jgi:purine-binding chemotaxis protein CheW